MKRMVFICTMTTTTTLTMIRIEVNSIMLPRDYKFNCCCLMIHVYRAGVDD